MYNFGPSHSKGRTGHFCSVPKNVESQNLAMKHINGELLTVTPHTGKRKYLKKTLARGMLAAFMRGTLYAESHFEERRDVHATYAGGRREKRRRRRTTRAPRTRRTAELSQLAKYKVQILLERGARCTGLQGAARRECVGGSFAE